MKNITVLDVTLRDGGCVNNFEFGQDYMDRILDSLEQSKVEYIELGYIDQYKGSEQGRTQYTDEKVISQYFLKKKIPNVSYVAMIDYGKFDFQLLGDKKEDGIDGIRVAFHKKDWEKIVEIGHLVMAKGYDFYIQPMITLRYSDKELLNLIEMVNSELNDASGFYIVDSFGELRPNDMNRIINLVDHNLTEKMTLGFHSHNNLQLSYSNAISLIQFPTNRNIMLDCSIMGMGKGAGNLNTELLLEYLNMFYGKNYNTAPLLNVIDTVINQIHSEFYWGYAVEYYLSAINQCTPSYAGYFYNKHMLSIESVSELLEMIQDNKKISFDAQYAENLYYQYNASREFDDSKVVEFLKQELSNKSILLIAPGKSIETQKEIIEEKINDSEIISVSLNNYGVYDTDYIFITRPEFMPLEYAGSSRVITLSNNDAAKEKNTYVVNYKRWAEIKGETRDSSGVIILQLLEYCQVKEIYMAGFDGFVSNINNNYYNKSLRHPVTEEQAIERNEWYKAYIREKQKTMKISFLTNSLYE